ncbi:MAG: hypothetical protein KG003_14200 [Bacteroidetes bacterium]|nr:hypothetical protein [Bacteroidota bacterium]
MKSSTLLLVLVLITFCVESCSYGNRIAIQVTKINEAHFEKSHSQVEVYFEETQPPKEFMQIAFIEVTGTEYSSTDTLLSALKTNAQSVGADAVIMVKKQYKNRQTGELISELMNKDIKPNEYSAPILTGIAIKYK